jgi:hypothetical protein
MHRQFNPDLVARGLREANALLSVGDPDLQAVVLVENNVDQYIALGESVLV